MRTRNLVAGCALAGTAALAAVGAARAKSAPAELRPIEPAAHAAVAGALRGTGWMGGAATAVRRQANAESRAVQQAAAPLADRLVAAVLKPSPQPAVPPLAAAMDPPRPARPQSGTRPPDQHAFLKQLLSDAAQRHGLDPGLVMAVSWWESGWDMTKVSDTGALGLMQIDPATARDLGPKLLHRQIDIHTAYDNADLGAAVLKSDLQDSGGNLAVALASYYEGGGNVDPSNLDANAQAYVDGVLALQKEFDAGQDPAAPASPTPSPSP